jgi:hypothetical protein
MDVAGMLHDGDVKLALLKLPSKITDGADWNFAGFVI